MRMALPVLRADYAAIERYVCTPDATTETSITALTGDRDPKTTVDEVGVWEKHTTADFELEVYAGGHFFLADHADTVNSLLADHLDQSSIARLGDPSMAARNR
jgi:pyochelin biosynthesis protein PchC